MKVSHGQQDALRHSLCMCEVKLRMMRMMMMMWHIFCPDSGYVHHVRMECDASRVLLMVQQKLYLSACAVNNKNKREK